MKALSSNIASSNCNNNDQQSLSSSGGVTPSSATSSARPSPSAAAAAAAASFTHLKSPRKMWYCALVISSLIAMGCTFEAVKMQRKYTASTSPPTPKQKWAVASITMTFLLTFLTLSLLFVSPTRAMKYLHGTKLELILILLLCGFTMSCVGTATNPASGMAVNSSGGISFGNLYYSTWCSFISATGALLSFLRTERGLDISSELSSRGNRFRGWSILIIVTLIVMGSSASCYDAKCDGTYNDYQPVKYCRRAAFGVSSGCVGCVASLAVVAMRITCGTTTPGRHTSANRTIFIIEGVLSVVLFCMYGFAVAYLTSEKGPGAPLGNLYYSSWVAFALTFFVATSCFEEFQAAKNMILLGRQQHQESHQGSSVGDYEREALNSDAISVETDRTSSVGDSTSRRRDDSQTGQSSTSSGVSQRVTGSVGEVQV